MPPFRVVLEKLLKKLTSLRRCPSHLSIIAASRALGPSYGIHNGRASTFSCSRLNRLSLHGGLRSPVGAAKKRTGWLPIDLDPSDRQTLSAVEVQGRLRTNFTD